MTINKKQTIDFIKLIKTLNETEKMGVLIMLNGVSMLKNKKRTAISRPFVQVELPEQTFSGTP